MSKYKVVPISPSRNIEDAIGRARNLSASEIWEDALAAASETGMVDITTADNSGEYVRLSDYEALQAECEKLRAELDAHKAARIAYASEFPLNEDGVPDTGNIHHNIRVLKAENKYLYLQLQHMIDQTIPLEPVPDDPKWSRRIRIDSLLEENEELANMLESFVDSHGYCSYESDAAKESDEEVQQARKLVKKVREGRK